MKKISPYAFLPLLGLLNAWVAIQSINPFEDFFTGAFLWLAIFPTWFIEMPILKSASITNLSLIINSFSYHKLVYFNLFFLRGLIYGLIFTFIIYSIRKKKIIPLKILG